MSNNHVPVPGVLDVESTVLLEGSEPFSTGDVLLDVTWDEGLASDVVEGGNVLVDTQPVNNVYVSPLHEVNVTVGDSGSCVFSPPTSAEGRVIEVFQACIDGYCSCDNEIGGVYCNLKPCRVGYFLFSGMCSLPSDYVSRIWNGLCDGFKIVDETCEASYDCENYHSITEGDFKKEMSNLLMEELREGKVSMSETKPRCIHSLGAVPKSDGRLRPITDCSRPETISINNFMASTCSEFKYNSVNDVTKILDEGDFMSVVDVASAYRSVPRLSRHTLEFDDGGGDVFLKENRLCFGLKCAPFIFSLLSELVVDMVRCLGVERIVNYLDDFIVVEPTLEKCMESQDVLINVLRHMGFAISWKKVSPPGTMTTFLGICIDSVEMSLTLPASKIEKLLAVIGDLEKVGRASKKQLESLGGLVSHFSSVIRGGRTFCRRIFDLSVKCKRSHSVKLNEEMMLDLSWWKNLCNSLNGSAKIIGKEFSTSFITDASVSGFGGWSEGDWFLGSWAGIVPDCLAIHDHVVEPPSNSDLFSENINVYEPYAVLASIRRWGPIVRDTAVQIVTDNNQVLFMINTGRSANCCCMSWLREIFWLCFIFNIEIYAVYIRSKDNVFADALSHVSSCVMKNVVLDTVADLNLCCHAIISRTFTGGAKQKGI